MSFPMGMIQSFFEEKWLVYSLGQMKKMGPLNKIQKDFDRNAGESYVRKHIYWRHITEMRKKHTEQLSEFHDAISLALYSFFCLDGD